MVGETVEAIDCMLLRTLAVAAEVAEAEPAFKFIEVMFVRYGERVNELLLVVAALEEEVVVAAAAAAELNKRLLQLSKSVL